MRDLRDICRIAPGRSVGRFARAAPLLGLAVVTSACGGDEYSAAAANADLRQCYSLIYRVENAFVSDEFTDPFTDSFTDSFTDGPPTSDFAVEDFVEFRNYQSLPEVYESIDASIDDIEFSDAANSELAERSAREFLSRCNPERFEQFISSDLMSDLRSD